MSSGSKPKVAVSIREKLGRSQSPIVLIVTSSRTPSKPFIITTIPYCLNRSLFLPPPPPSASQTLFRLYSCHFFPCQRPKQLSQEYRQAGRRLDYDLRGS
ncbi:unnamed protein product [Musa acuminata subsp. burmannicoides]